MLLKTYFLWMLPTLVYTDVDDEVQGPILLIHLSWANFHQVLDLTPKQTYW